MRTALADYAAWAAKERDMNTDAIQSKLHTRQAPYRPVIKDLDWLEVKRRVALDHERLKWYSHINRRDSSTPTPGPDIL